MADEQKPASCLDCGEPHDSPEKMGRLQKAANMVVEVLYAETRDPTEGVDVLVNCLLNVLKGEFEAVDPITAAIDVLKNTNLIVPKSVQTH